MTSFDQRFAHTMSMLQSTTDMRLAGPLTDALLRNVPFVIRVNSKHAKPAAILTVWPGDADADEFASRRQPNKFGAILVVTDNIHPNGLIIAVQNLTWDDDESDEPHGVVWLRQNTLYLNSPWLAAIHDILTISGFSAGTKTSRADRADWLPYTYEPLNDGIAATKEVH